MGCALGSMLLYNITNEHHCYEKHHPPPFYLNRNIS